MTTALHLNLPPNATIADLRSALDKIPATARVTDDVGRSIREIVIDGDGDVTLTPLPPIRAVPRKTIEFAMPQKLIEMSRRGLTAYNDQAIVACDDRK